MGHGDVMQALSLVVAVLQLAIAAIDLATKKPRR